MEDIKETDVIEEITENVDTTTTEEKVGGAVEEQEKSYSQTEVDEIVERRIARERAKIHKQYEKKAKLADIVCAGTGKDVDGAADSMSEYYQSKGIELPKYSPYSDRDMKILAEAEAKEIIEAGADEVEAELKELAKVSPDKLDARQKEKLNILDNYRQQEARVKELASIGVPDIVYNSSEFKNFAAQFNAGTPMKTVYDLYTKTSGSRPKTDNPGSMKNTNPSGDMDIFTPEEVDKLTPQDYDNPKIMAKVRRSMMSW